MKKNNNNNNYNYDILILGSGPIALSTAYFLKKNGVQNVGLVTQDPTDERSATYRYSGGSLRWFWPDELKTTMTKMTADFIDDLDKKGVDLSLIRDNYLFLNQGRFVPSMNLNASQLMDWFMNESLAQGLIVHKNEIIQSVKKENGLYNIITTDGNVYKSKKVLMALGVKNPDFVLDYELEIEKRELYVLDISVDETRGNFPHTIIPIGKGVAYVFLKKIDDDLRFVVGQEGIISEGVKFTDLLDAGLGTAMPFLKNAHVQKILWGYDAGNKGLKLEDRDGLFIANCGSAIRGCVWIGTEIAQRIAMLNSYTA